MRISSVLANIDNGFFPLPEFQRGYVWNREQVRSLFESLYRRHPIGGPLVWTTESRSAVHRGEADLPPGVVNLLLDGQQRMTTLYRVVRGRPPPFFDGNIQTLTDLRFHLESESFAFYQPIKMRDDPLWVDVTSLMRKGYDGLHEFIESNGPDARHLSALTRLLGTTDIDLHVEEVAGAEKTLDVVVDIFNRVNSGGTKLSKGDLALAKICADWPEARESMKRLLRAWTNSGYNFSLDWLLRSVNTVLTGEAKFAFLHDKSKEEIQGALTRARTGIDKSLNMIAGRLGLDHDRVLFGRYGVPVMVRYLDRRGGSLPAEERDKLLFWFVQAGMWGRFSGSSETYIDQDLAAVDSADQPLDKLLEQLRLWHGGLRVEPGHFTGWSLGARFYPVLYMLTLMRDARDWGTGLALRSELLGHMSRLQMHHIFPKSRLYEYKVKTFARPEVNALGNFCFLTQDTNLEISNRLPEEYFPEVESKHPGALASQWIPSDPQLWKIDRYLDFLAARRRLLAAETNRCMEELLHGDTRWLQPVATSPRETAPPMAPGGIATKDEESRLESLNEWVGTKNLPRGEMSFEYTNPDTGEQLAVFDLAWPTGLQADLSEPVAVLLDEGRETLAIAATSEFRCFTREQEFRSYIETEISPSGTEN